MLDLALSIEAMACVGGVRSPYASAAVALDFTGGQYWAGGSQAASLAAMPGYTYTRTGAMAVVDSDNSIDAFAANTPPINGYGYHAYGALTNSLLQSQVFDNASWTKTSTSVSANAAVAPDGTSTADQITVTAGTTFHNVWQNAGTYTGDVTADVFLKAGTQRYVQVIADTIGGDLDYQNFDLQTGAMGNGPVSSTITSCGNGWYRCVLNGTGNGAAPGLYLVPVSGLTAARAESFAAAGTETFYAWQAQELRGVLFPEGGPLIATTGATASIGAPTLSVTCANGSYTATYTFDDDSTQDIPTTIAAGAFAMPTYPTLNRPRVKRVVVA